MLGTLAHYDSRKAVGFSRMQPLDRLMLHKLAELDETVRHAYANFDYARVVSVLSQFMNTDLSAFYFDIRKDALYCEPPSSEKRLGALEAIDHLFRALTIWLAPILVFTTEEAWLAESAGARSVHRQLFPTIPPEWRDPGLATQWETIRRARLAVTGAIEIARAAKEIGSSLEAHPIVYVSDPKVAESLAGVDFAEVCITSDITVVSDSPPAGAFATSDAPGLAVTIQRARGVKCARSWRYFDPATADPDFPDVTSRDAEALRELGFGRV
jgi:isoleucyl-tRNA synthetase